MRRAKAWIIIPLFVLVLITTADGLTVDEALQRQERALEIEALERAAKRAGSGVEYGATLEEGITQLFQEGVQAAGGILRSGIRSGVLLLSVVLLCGVGDTLHKTLAGDGRSVVPLVGALAVTAVAAADVQTMLGLGRNTIETITSFSNILLPTVAAVTAATGAITGAAVRQMAAVLFSDLLVNLIDKLLIPLLYGYLVISVACAALGNEGLKRVGAFLKWLVTTILTSVLLAFVGYLSVSGIIAGTTDAAAIKATKFAISGAIPVVGGILSDAAETILASANILKGTVGGFGMLTILGLCLLPLMRLAVHYLVYKLAAALSAAMSDGRIGALVEQISGVFGLLLGMTGACSLLLLVALVSSVSAVSV